MNWALFDRDWLFGSCTLTWSCKSDSSAVADGKGSLYRWDSVVVQYAANRQHTGHTRRQVGRQKKKKKKIQPMKKDKNWPVECCF